MQFIVDTSGLSAYPHTFNIPLGKMFLQANISSSKSIAIVTGVPSPEAT